MFIPEAQQSDIKKERNRARELRNGSWWKRKRSKGLCYYCNSKVHPNDLTMDHIIPIIRGGRSSKCNIVAACKECNNKKKHMLPLEWEEYLHKLNSDD